MNCEMTHPPHTSYEDTRLDESKVTLPFVSIIVTAYNYSKYIRQCLDSVLRQTYPHWELILVDDVSTDNTVEILETYLAEHGSKHSMQLVRRKENGGQMEAFRDGLKQARGTFVMMLDADDVLLADFLETHMKVHLGRKAVAFTSSNQYQINEYGNIICGDHPDHLSKGEYRYLPQQPFLDTWWVWATASSMVFRRSTLKLIMPDKNITFRICADYYLAHFCQQVGNSILIPSVHGCYRRHEENNFSSNPLVGAINTMGDFTRHPPHDDFRKAMIQHVLSHFDRFKPIFGQRGIQILLFRLATYKEMKEILRDHKDRFKGCPGICDYKRFHRKRKHYDRGPWANRMMCIKPPQTYFVPPPPEPGDIYKKAIKTRLRRFILGEEGGYNNGW